MALVRYNSAFFQDQLQTPHIGDVLERIGCDHNQVGELARLHRAQLSPISLAGANAKPKEAASSAVNNANEEQPSRKAGCSQSAGTIRQQSSRDLPRRARSLVGAFIIVTRR